MRTGSLKWAVAVLLAACIGCSDGDGTFEATVVKADSGGSTAKDGGGSSSGGTADAGTGPEDVPANKPPVATDDVAKTKAGIPVLIDVRANDSDPDDDKFKVTKVTQGQLGLVKINAPGWDVTYEPLDGKSLGVDSFTYTINDGNGGTDTATVTVKIEPPPTLVITAPQDGSQVKPENVTVSFKVNGCNFTYPSQDNDGCHAHKYLDGAKWKDKEGKGFGQYTLKPFSLGDLKPGKHTFKLQLIKNDGSDQPFEPEIADTVSFEVTKTTAD